MHIKRGLKGLEKITEFIKIVLASGYVADDKPLSLIMVAPVSSGKTTSIKQFQKNKNISILSDLTAYGVLEKHQKELENGEIRHIFVPDMLNPLSRRETTVKTLLLFINASSEDGLFPSSTYGIQIKRFIEPFGWVLCITDDGYKMKKRYLDKIGFTSRFFTIHWEYTLEQIQNILQGIIEEEKFSVPDIKLKTIKKKKKVKGNKKIFEELATYSKLLVNGNNPQVLRMQRKLQTFLKANAYLRGDDKVTNQDLEKLKELIDLVK